MHRRTFLELSSALGAGLLLPEAGRPARLARSVRSPELERFVDRLPILPVLRPAASQPYRGATYYEIVMAEGRHRFHRDLGAARTWGYGGVDFLGPTIEATSRLPIVVKWINQLPRNHPLPVDFTLRLANPGGLPARTSAGTPSGPIPTVPHLHGGPTLPQFDGHPEAWWTPDLAQRGPHFVSDVYHYNNNVQAATLWYHDHALGITRLNVYAGLAGCYFVRDEVEAGLGLPSGAYEIPLIIQDRVFTRDGSLAYPATGVSDAHPIWTPEMFGDTPIVNGKAYPVLEVEPRRYRLRLLNGSNARFYRVWLEGRGRRVPLYQIGGEGGFLAAVAAPERLLLASGERADVIVDFSGLPTGTTLTLRNDAPVPFPAGDGEPLEELLRIRVSRPMTGRDGSTRVEALRLPTVQRLDPAKAARRSFAMIEHHDTKVLLLDGRPFTDPVTDRVKADSTEVWEYVNTTGDAHPMHLHLVQFQVLERQRLDAAAYLAAWERGERNGPDAYLRDGAIAPPPEELGWKDTAIANPGEVLRIIARFDRPSGEIQLPAGIEEAQYVHHCHILEHEDNEMMRPFALVR
jgi:spore coat protein A